MIRTTFGELVDRLAVRLNETKIPDGRFDNVQGVHAAMKEAILHSVRDILHGKIKWPFLAVEQTVTLDDGTNEYAWPLDFDTVDWNSFQIQPDKDKNLKAKFLKVIQREEWYRLFKDTDIDRRPDGIRIPDYVFSAHGMGFGVTPAPNQDFKLKYRYFKYPKLPELKDDLCPIPSKYDNVIISGALKVMYSFLDNNERANFWDAQFKSSYNDMARVELGNNLNYVYSGMLDNNRHRVMSGFFG